MTLVGLVFFLSNCASIVSKSEWPLKVTTNPSGAKIVITDKDRKEVFNGTSPTTVVLKSSAGYFQKQSYLVKLSLNGVEKTVPVECSVSGWYVLGNIVFGGLIGWLIVDPATGAMYQLDKELINEDLTPKTSYAEPTLKIMNLNEIPLTWRSHLVSIK